MTGLSLATARVYNATPATGEFTLADVMAALAAADSRTNVRYHLGKLMNLGYIEQVSGGGQGCAMVMRRSGGGPAAVKP